MDKNKLAAVIIFYNPTNKDLKSIDKIYSSVDKIYVVDNSEDDIIRVKNSKKIKYLKNNQNLGVATALNIGAKNAIIDGYEWLLTLDQDSNMSGTIISKMLNFINKYDRHKLGVVSPLHKIKYEENHYDNEYEKVLEVMTSGNIINLKVYKKIGGFKDWLFIDDVDIDYCLNVNKNGYDVIRLNNVLLEHNLGDRCLKKFLWKKVICSNHNAYRRYYMTRNTLYINSLYKDTYPDYCKFLIRSQKGQLKRIIVFEKDKIRKIRMIMKGYVDYKKGIKGKLS